MEKKENKLLFVIILIVVIVVSVGVTWTTLENEYDTPEKQDQNYADEGQLSGEGVIGSAKVGINITGK